MNTLGEMHKYLGILEADTIKQVEISYKKSKKSISEERENYTKTDNSRNLRKRINPWSVPLVRYSGSFLMLTRKKPKRRKLRTRNLITMPRALHSRDYIDILYV